MPFIFTTLWGRILSGLLIAALAVTALQTYRAGYWKRVATVLRLDLDKIKLAQELAASQWQAKLSDNEAKQRAAIQGARNEERRKGQLAAADAYARANRVVRPQAAKGPGPKPGDAKVDPATGNDGPGADAEMVALSRDEFDLFVGNTLRLDTVRRQAEALIASGAAIKETAVSSQAGNRLTPQP